LDMMLRDKEQGLRIEEVSVPPSFVGQPISTLKLKKYRSVLLLAIRDREDLTYNPPEDYVIQGGNTLIFMGTPDDRQGLEKILFQSH